MYECSIESCGEVVAERGRDIERWLRLRACRCGAYNLDEPKSCTCRADESESIPTSYWPNLDWWILGGVEEVILCPIHRRQVFHEVIKQRDQDPSMNQEKQNPGNVH